MNIIVIDDTEFYKELYPEVLDEVIPDYYRFYFCKYPEDFDEFKDMEFELVILDWMLKDKNDNIVFSDTIYPMIKYKHLILATGFADEDNTQEFIKKNKIENVYRKLKEGSQREELQRVIKKALRL